MRLHFSDLLLCLQPAEWSDALRRPLLKGLPLSLFGQVPNGMLVYGSYEVYKREIHERFPGMNPNQVAPSLSLHPFISPSRSIPFFCLSASLFPLTVFPLSFNESWLLAAASYDLN